MPDDEPAGDGRALTGFGVASTALGVVAVAAVVLASLIWSGHRRDVDERHYQSDVLQAAADWTSTLINMNKDTVDASLQKLHAGTVGQLNADFESTVQPYRQLVARLQSRTTGQVDSVAIESLHQPSDGAPPPQKQPELAAVASRTDTVLVVATSISQNAGTDKPQIVHWTLRMDVSDIEDELKISRLEPIR